MPGGMLNFRIDRRIITLHRGTQQVLSDKVE